VGHRRGGTTTDIAVLRDGFPRLSPEGARVGRWRTMIETVDVHTAGLGGDSQVRVAPGTRVLTIGPRRSVPLCQLAAGHPPIVEELRRQLAAREHLPLTGQFSLPQRRSRAALDPRGQELLDHLDSTPRSLLHLARVLPAGLLVVHQLEELEARQVVQRAGFTPTDALHVLGRFQRWNTEAARLGAELLAAQLGVAVEVLCERVVAEFSRRLAAELAAKALADEGCPPAWEEEPGATALLGRALGRVPDTSLSCALTLNAPVVAVGAPVEAYLPEAAGYLHTELVIPPHAGVANALGSVATGVVQRLRVLVRPHDVLYRFHLPEQVLDFADLETGIARAQETVVPHLQALARQAGAPQTEVQMTREDRTAPDGYGGGGEIYVESELVFTAVGGPGLRPANG
jgi:N-methylhydantoinase A/oxoprolinase/acetone carboxylase beta subunit